MDTSLNNSIAVYKDLLAQGDVQIVYEALRKYMLALKAYFSHELSDKYSFGNVSPGYMDYTYFPFFDEYLRNQKLRFGVVLHHREMRFELWLMGKNAEVQARYWELFKNTRWNKNRTSMPQYSVLEVVIVENPDFDNLDSLSAEIENRTIGIIKEIMDYLKQAG